MKIRNLNSWEDGTILIAVNGVEHEILNGDEIEINFLPRSRKLSVFQEDPFSAEGAMNIVRQANQLAYEKEVEGVVKQAMDFGESDPDYDRKMSEALNK